MRIFKRICSEIAECNYIFRTKCSFRLLPEHDMSSETTEPVMKIMIVGLGNKGFAKTRHSVGFQFVDRIAEIQELRWLRRTDMRGSVIERHFSVKSDVISVVLLKSKHFMNDNGKTVAKALREYRVEPANMYVVHDDLDRGFGKVTIKKEGSAEGHNGVRSVISCIGTDEFPRLKIGIGRPDRKSEVVKYVLTNFNKDEAAELPAVLESGLEKLKARILEKVTPLIKEKKQREYLKRKEARRLEDIVKAKLLEKEGDISIQNEDGNKDIVNGENDNKLNVDNLKEEQGTGQVLSEKNVDNLIENQEEKLTDSVHDVKEPLEKREISLADDESDHDDRRNQTDAENRDNISELKT